MSEFDPQHLHLSAWRRAIRRAFPERYVMVRSDGGGYRSWTLGSVTQAIAAGVAVVLLGVFTYGIATAVWVDALIDAKNAEVHRAEDNYKQLLAEVALYRDQVAAVTRSLEDNHAVLARYMDEGDANKAASPDAAKASDSASVAEAGRARDALLAQLATMEEGMAELSEAHQLLNQFDGFELEMRKMVLQRDLALDENKALTSRIGDLEKLVVEMESAQAALLEHFGAVAQTRIADLESTLNGVGLNVDHLLEQALAHGHDNQGGPFIPAILPMLDTVTFKDTLASLNTHVGRLGALKSLTTMLPLTRPVLHNFRVSSPFGVRQDPVNGRLARHEGIDFAAPLGTPVVAPADGKVVYVGWRRGYGRCIDISHGLGLVTRYAHLSEADVAKGDQVVRGQQIGRIGNTGRSTGPHLHYEIRVNGVPRNPARFIEAGQHVFQGQS